MPSRGAAGPAVTESELHVDQSSPSPFGGDGKEPDNNGAGGGGAAVERVTVNLSARSVHAMNYLAKSTDDTKTDVINKALQVYFYVQEVMDQGGRIYTREAGSNELERLRFM